MQLSRGRLLFVAGLAVLYAVFLAWYHCPYAAGSDSSGYMNSARLLLEGKLSTPLRVTAGLTADVLPRMYLYPLGMRLDAIEQNLVPAYPVGLPLHYAAVGLVTGLDPAVTVVGVLSALAFALLLYLTAREFGVTPGWSAAVTLLAAISPLTLQFALRVMSDLVAATWALAVILCALRSSRHAGWAVGAGAALAMAVLIRPTNALLFLPAALALQPRLRIWIAFGLGGAPAALFLAWYNHALYGTYLTTGYGNVSTMFGARHLLPTVQHFALWLPVVATPFVLAAAALPWLKVGWRAKLVLVAWAVPFFFLYGLYECTQETWWYLRFILPALPALLIAAALGLQRINYPSWFLASRLLPGDATSAEVARGRVARVPLVIILFLAATGWMLAWDRALKISQAELEERSYLQVGRWVAGQMPAPAIVAGYQVSGAILYYTDRPFINPINMLPDDFARFSAWLDREHRPLYAVLYPYEESDILQRMPGRWEVVTKLRQATIWRRLGPGDSPASLP
jgi:hypothetical protein